MGPFTKDSERAARIGLCATCRHSRRITSDRGSEFWRCELSKVDASFDRYPRLPVLNCAGYQPLTAKKAKKVESRPANGTSKE